MAILWRDTLEKVEIYALNVTGENMAKKFIKEAIKHPGALHKQLHVPAGKKIPVKKLKAAEKKGGLVAKRAHLAETLRKLPRHKGPK